MDELLGYLGDVSASIRMIMATVRPLDQAKFWKKLDEATVQFADTAELFVCRMSVLLPQVSVKFSLRRRVDVAHSLLKRFFERAINQRFQHDARKYDILGSIARLLSLRKDAHDGFIWSK